MGQVHQVPAQPKGSDAGALEPPVTIRRSESAHCGLCGARLSAKELRYHVISPQCCETITVCRTCHKAALGEGYRPAE